MLLTIGKPRRTSMLDLKLQELRAQLRDLVRRGHGSSLRARELRSQIKAAEATEVARRVFNNS
jgi:hypothetical protein